LVASEATNGFNAAYFAALSADHDLGSIRGIDDVLRKHQLDALVLPATGFTTVPPGKPNDGRKNGSLKLNFSYRWVSYRHWFASIFSNSLIPIASTDVHNSVPLGFFPENVSIGQAGPNLVYPAPGVPFGLSFFGTAFSEFDLISFAYAYEQATQTRLARRAFSAAIPKTQLEDIVSHRG